MVGVYVAEGRGVAMTTSQAMTKIQTIRLIEMTVLRRSMVVPYETGM
jgi:hypothetical protein